MGNGGRGDKSKQKNTAEQTNTLTACLLHFRALATSTIRTALWNAQSKSFELVSWHRFPLPICNHNKGIQVSRINHRTRQASSARRKTEAQRSQALRKEAHHSHHPRRIHCQGRVASRPQSHIVEPAECPRHRRGLAMLLVHCSSDPFGQESLTRCLSLIPARTHRKQRKRV